MALSFICNPEGMHFCVQEWDERGMSIVQTLAAARKFSVASFAFDEAISENPRLNITLQQGTRVIRKSRDG